MATPLRERGRRLPDTETVSVPLAKEDISIRVIQTLIHALNDESSEVNGVAAASLGKCGVKGAELAVGALMAKLKDTDPFVREVTRF